MGGVFCLVSGCTPQIVKSLDSMCNEDDYFSPLVRRAFQDFSDTHEYFSQNDLSVIGPIHPSGQPFAVGREDGLTIEEDDIGYEEEEEDPGPPPSEICPETDIRVVPYCFLSDQDGFVRGPRVGDWDHFVSYGSSLVVQTYAIDIMEVATEGRMTPLRLWRLAMKQGFYEMFHPSGLKGVDYGGISDMRKKWENYHDEIFPDLFPGLGQKEWKEVEELAAVEDVKQRFVHEGKFWLWLAPDRFPISPTQNDPPAPTLLEVSLCASHGLLESLPLNILVLIASYLPLESLVNLASTSRLLRKNILGNQHLARAWICTSAPWWRPVPTRTPMISVEDGPSPAFPLPYLASQPTPAPSNEQVEGRTGIASLDWAYIRRCARSGSMRNRRRIWKAVLDIERFADKSDV